MSKVSRNFTNEIGNAIRVEVRTEMVSGVDGIVVFIAGPDSDTEFLITRNEAVAIREMLDKTLGHDAETTRLADSDN